MNTINLFGQELEYKNYDCSKDLNSYRERPPFFNLYLQITDLCNANCIFCDKAGCTNKDSDLDFDKLEKVLQELLSKNLLKKISITGGEPLLNIKKLNRVLDIIFSISKNIYVSINTNGSYLDNFRLIDKKYFINEVDISRHHYNEKENKNLFGIEVPSLNGISRFMNDYKHLNVKLNCVMTSNLINSAIEIEKYLEVVSQYGIKEVRFISLLELTDSYKKLCIDTNKLIEDLMKHTNAGLMYDKEICQCFSFMYVSSNGFPITVFIRDTKQATCNYMRQMVYTPQNKLLNGFGGKIII